MTNPTYTYLILLTSLIVRHYQQTPMRRVGLNIETIAAEPEEAWEEMLDIPFSCYEWKTPILYFGHMNLYCEYCGYCPCDC